VSQPEESSEKTPKTDDILLKPVLKDLDDVFPDLAKHPKKRRHPKREQDQPDEDT